jgi:perosamine synthetase
VQLDEREIRAVEEVLRSGRLRAGRVVEDFEARFARSVGAPFAVAVNSGTAALFLAYRALLKPGDEIIVPDFTFVATASMAAAVGARPVFADVDPVTCTLDPADIEKRITRRTRALAPVHLYGHPARVDRLTHLARKHHLRIIWDAAQAHGAQYRGRDVGSLPDVVCYSFYPSKNMTTAEGGMITTSDERLAAEFRLARSHGEESRYHHTRLGFNFRLTDVLAALGREQLRKLPQALRRRRRNAAILARGLSGIPGLVLPHTAPGVQHAFNLFTVRVNARVLGVSRDELQKVLAEQGIETAVHYPRALHQQPIFRGFGTDCDFPVSAELAKTVLSIPVHPALSDEDLHRVITSVRKIVRQAFRRAATRYRR